MRGAGYRFELDDGALTIRLRRATAQLTVALARAGVRVSLSAPRRPRLRVTETDEHGHATHLIFTLGLQR